MMNPTDPPTASARALVFSGGGLKGAAFIGALAALQEDGCTFDMFGGSSSGSVVAVLCGAGFSTEQMRTLMGDLAKQPPGKLRDFNLRGLLSLVTLSPRHYLGLYKGDLLERYVESTLATFGKREFADLTAPTFVVTVNALTGEELVCTNLPAGDLGAHRHASDVTIAAAVRASTSLPGIFVPKSLRNGYYLDGGIRSLLPIVAAHKLGATEILGISFTRRTSTEEHTLGGGVASIVSRTVDLLLDDQVESDVSLLQAEGLDPLIIELPVGDPDLFDLREIPQLIEAGYHETRAILDAQPGIVARFRS